jgi:hypothetical protein
VALTRGISLIASEVSDYDRSRFEERAGPLNERGCRPWLGSKDSQGYGILWMTSGPKRKKNALAHRLSYAMQRGEVSGRTVVMHKCDNPICVNPDHLEGGSQQDNIRDRDRKKRQKTLRGSDNPRARLELWDVIAIRADRRKLTDIAADYSIAMCTVSAIKHRRIWAHVPEFQV